MFLIAILSVKEIMRRKGSSLKIAPRRWEVMSVGWEAGRWLLDAEDRSKSKSVESGVSARAMSGKSRFVPGLFALDGPAYYGC